MVEVRINGETILHKTMLHDDLKEALHFPRWYGKNLDALYDCLTDLSEDTVLLLSNRSSLQQNLGVYEERFERVLRQAAAKNPHLTVEILED